MIAANAPIWLILANTKPILSCSIFQNNWRGSCTIPAAIKVAENAIPIGSHRMR